MLRSFKPDLGSHLRDPRQLVRGVLGVLLLANLVAVFFVFRTPGGTLEELESQVIGRRTQLLQQQQAVVRLKQMVEHTEAAREAGDHFLNSYFLPRRHAYSMLELDLLRAAKAAGIRARERTNSYEPIEGSDTLGMLNISANFEGTYADLIQMVNELDRSHRLLIIEQLQATPQQGTNSLAILVKLNAFFRAEGPQEADVEVPAEALRPVQKEPVIQVKPAMAAPVRQPVARPMPIRGGPPPPQASEPRSGPMRPSAMEPGEFGPGSRPGQMPGMRPGGPTRIVRPGAPPENQQ
jgi:Tfp pilus assembly protein PilO